MKDRLSLRFGEWPKARTALTLSRLDCALGDPGPTRLVGQ
jgi:hypothetical protein